MSRPSTQKALKKRRKQKVNRKRRNIEKNVGSPVWRLDVEIDGKWYTARKYRRQEQLRAHMEDTEARRKAGEVIVPGKVVHIETGRVVRTIEPSGEQPLVAKGPLDAKELTPATDEVKNVKAGGVFNKIFGKNKSRHRIAAGDAQ